MLQVSIQYLEIYNEQLFDLLDITTQPHELNIQEVRGNVNVTGLRSIVVRSEAEAMKLLFEVRSIGLSVRRTIYKQTLNRFQSSSSG